MAKTINPTPNKLSIIVYMFSSEIKLTENRPLTLSSRAKT